MTVASGVVEVAARPSGFAFEPSATAVVVVDMQNDFASPGGMFDRAGIDISCIQAIVPNVQTTLERARAAGMLVVYLKMGFGADLVDSGYPTSPTWLKHAPMHVGDAITAPTGQPSRILVRDCWNTEIVGTLAPAAGDVVVYKHRYSGFFETELDAILRGAGIERLIVMGATTSVCVDSTVRDAVFLGYHCLVLSDATAEPIANDAVRSNHESSLLTFELLFASVGVTADFVAGLEAVGLPRP